MKIFLRIIIAFCCFAFAAEIIARLVVLISAGKTSVDSIEKTKLLVSQNDTDPIRCKMKIHPYLGALTKEGIKFSENNPNPFYTNRILGISRIPSYYENLIVNNHGFWMYQNLPYIASEKTFVIGIFGGSVAYHFCLSAMDGESRTLKTLKSLYKSKGYEIVFLNLASGGLKQPQQLLTLAYLLSIGQKFDMVINIDGFNEAYVSWINQEAYKIDPSMPCGQFIYGIMNAAILNQLQEKLVSSPYFFILQCVNKINSKTKSFFLFLVSELATKKLNKNLTNISKDLTNQENHKIDYPIQIVKTKKTFWESGDDIVGTWASASVSMDSLCKRNNIPYIHVMQPNQYFPSAKKFTDKEIKEYNVLGAAEVPLQKIVPFIYSKMKKESKNLIDRGVCFIDGTQAFDEKQETVYIDWACHFNENGNVGLSLFIEDGMQKRGIIKK